METNANGLLTHHSTVLIFPHFHRKPQLSRDVNKYLSSEQGYTFLLFI